MILTGSNPNILSLGEAGLYALLGYAVIFFGLILLMIVVVLVGKGFTVRAKKPAVSEAPAPEQAPEPVYAPGAAGQLKLHDVEPKTAAMLMAIVANKLGKPLCELRFISIKEVTE